MWSKLAQWAAQFLLIPLFKEIFQYLKDYLIKRAEQKKRHEKNKQKVEQYENSPETSSSDNFSQLP